MLFIWIVVGVAGAALLGRLASWAGAVRDRRRFPPRGRMYNVAGRSLHAVVQGPPATGAGQPTVVLEAALGASSLSWCHVQRQLAESFATLSYDRAGLGWSDGSSDGSSEAAGGTNGLDGALGDLRGLLAATGCKPPYVLVGHSYGGWIVRRFAALNPEELAGIVLVDSPDPAAWASPDAVRKSKLAVASRLARRGGWAARWGAGRLIVALLSLGVLPLARLMVKLASGGQLLGNHAQDGRRPWGGLATFAPLLKLPPELRNSLRSVWLRPAFYDTVAGTVATLPSRAALAAGPLPAGLPVAVLTAADADPEHQQRQRDLAAGEARFHAVAGCGGHWIPLEEPGLVVEAVHRVLAETAATDLRRQA